MLRNREKEIKGTIQTTLSIGTFTILSLLLLSFGFSNIQQAVLAQQAKQWPQISAGRYFSVQYPPDWKAEVTGRGVHLFAPDGFEILLETYVPVPSSVIYPSADTPMNKIAQTQIQLMSQKGFKYISSETMGNQNNPLIKNIYEYGDEYIIEYLAKRSSGILTIFSLAGYPDGINKYAPYTTKVFHNVQLSPAWEAEVRGLLDSIQQTILDTYGIAIGSITGMANDFRESAAELEEYRDRKACEERGFPGTTVCP